MNKDFIKLLCNFSNKCEDFDQKQYQSMTFPSLKHQLAASSAREDMETLLHVIFEHLDQNEDVVMELIQLRNAIDIIVPVGADDSIE